MELLESKILACTTLGIGSFIIGIIPLCFTNNRNQSSLLLSCLLCFGGGVLLSTSLTHMLPENREKLNSDYQQYAEIIFCIGFFILYIVDEIVHFVYGGTHGDHSILNQTETISRRHSTSHHQYGAFSETTPLWKGKQPPYNPQFYKTKSDSFLFFDNAPSQLCHVGHQEPCESSVPTISTGLVIALTLHSLIEGLVVGLESTPSKVLLLLGAISSHKFVVGFCLGLELTSNTTLVRHVMGILIFALGSMTGIGLGTFVSDGIKTTPSENILAVLQGLAGGTLLYVCLSEIIPRERARWHQQHEKRSAGILQFLSVGFGFSLMTILTLYLDVD